MLGKLDGKTVRKITSLDYLNGNFTIIQTFTHLHYSFDILEFHLDKALKSLILSFLDESSLKKYKPGITIVSKAVIALQIYRHYRR